MPFPIVPYLWEASAAQPISLLQRRLTEPYPVHGHDYFELELVVSGSGRQWLNGEALSMEPGCLYLLSPADFHRLEPNASLDVFSFHFTPEYAAQLGFSLVQEARHTQISSEETAQFAARLSPLAKPSAATDLFYQQELLILLLPLLLRLLRQGEAMQLRKPERRFQAGLKYVQAHHTDPELRLEDAGRQVTLAGWVQRVRKMGGMTFVDLRDRYGITQLAFNEAVNAPLCEEANKLGREYCIQIKGVVNERQSKNNKIPTGDVEIVVDELSVLSPSLTPPFTIEDNTDGGDDLRMKYRYLDLRRPAVRRNLELRHRMTILIRNFLDQQNFIEVETPILIGSTPEGARDFVVPSRMNPGQFYALPQSPQTLKQLLMVAGFDRYFQIAKCFRDEDLRADRQPEFTQIDCEMSFVDQEDVLQLFEEMARVLFREVRGVELPKLERMTWHEAMRRFGSDKPDLRFGMEFVELMDDLKGTGSFSVFDEAAYIGGIVVPGCADYSRKQLNELTDFVKRPQIGAKGLVFIKYNADGTVKSSIDKFYTPEQLAKVKETTGAKDGDLVLILSGDNANKTRIQLCSLRLEMGNRLGLRDKNVFKCLWIIDFPLFEWSDEEQRLMATHHPFTMPNPDDLPLLDEHPEQVRAKAYDFVCNGIEVGGGSLRIHDTQLQEKMFEVLGFTPERAEAQFGFLMNAFKYGAPPHAGLAFGLDRFVSIMAGLDSIRDCIAFPKNNSGRDVMLDAPSEIDDKQLDELQIKVELKA